MPSVCLVKLPLFFFIRALPSVPFCTLFFFSLRLVLLFTLVPFPSLLFPFLLSSLQLLFYSFSFLHTLPPVLCFLHFSLSLFSPSLPSLSVVSLPFLPSLSYSSSCSFLPSLPPLSSPSLPSFSPSLFHPPFSAPLFHSLFVSLLLLIPPFHPLYQPSIAPSLLSSPPFLFLPPSSSPYWSSFTSNSHFTTPYFLLCFPPLTTYLLYSLMHSLLFLLFP